MGVSEPGVAEPRVDARAKVTGSYRYAADYYEGRPLWVAVRRAGLAHARVVSIDTSKAQAVDGVVQVLTHHDVRGSGRHGVVRADQPVLVSDKVRHAGDAIAIVIGRTRQAAEAGARAVEVQLEELPAVFDPIEALKPGAPIVHEDNPRGNLLLEGRVVRGKGAQALEECDVVVELALELGAQEHAYLETEAGWACYSEEEGLVVVASTQSPFRDRMELARALGLDVEKVRVIAPGCGGAFGGKDGLSIQHLLGLAAMSLPGQAVKMWLGREESFIASPKRHPAKLFYRLGARADGQLVAVVADIWFDTGAYDHLGGAVTMLGLEHAAGPYRVENVQLHARCVYTNNPVAGPFRGFGVPQVAAAMEQAMDELARRLGMDPLELRAKNALARGDKTPMGHTLECSCALGECIRRAMEHPLWRQREAWKAQGGVHKRRGVGVACVFHAMGYGPLIPDVAGAKVELTTEGKVRVFCGVVDMGQGNNPTMAQLASWVLCQPVENIELVEPDTAKCLASGSSSASRTTYTFANALLIALNRLKAVILGRASEVLLAPEKELELVPGAVEHPPTGRVVALGALAKVMGEAERVAVGRWRAPVAAPLPGQPQETVFHGLVHKVYSFAVHLAGVEVDELTGEVRVVKYVAITDCGRLINPQAAEQQVQGGVVQGLGYALSEEMIVDKGRILTRDLSTYLVPTAMDAPQVECIFVQSHEPSGPLGMKGMGELPTNAPMPAVANALADACGIRPGRMPLTPERVLMAMVEGGDGD